MNWQIRSFDCMGPIRFGMNFAEVEAVAGPPESTRKGLKQGSLTEFRGERAPIVKYRDDRVSEIEAFYDLQGVTYQGIRLFADNGLEFMRSLERLNGGALESVGTVLFDTLGLSSGRLDQPGREQHSVIVFKNDGLWNEQKHTFKSISFF